MNRMLERGRSSATVKDKIAVGLAKREEQKLREKLNAKK